ncbi:hypothetical protein L7F22_042944 [Adiantum nelumboides]|nr:hypothetical protein [Adiantum nelumboides]
MDNKRAAAATSSVAGERQGKMTCILSIDGGGIRGVIPAAILLFFEQQLQKLDGPDVRIADYFDVIAGTSTGGIIGGILSAPDEKGRPLFKADDIMDFYTKEGPKIFAKRGVPLLTQLVGPKHDSDVLESVLLKNLKDLKMKDTLSDLLVPTFDMKIMQPTYFSTSEAQLDESKNAYVRDVLRGTSAAPTYFPPHTFHTTTSTGETRTFNLVDGGVGINNPAHLSIAHTLYNRSKEKSRVSTTIDIEDYRNLLVLSLGTGKVVKSYDAVDAARWGVLSWVLKDGQVPIMDIVSECSADVVDYNLSVLFSILQRPDNYLRIQAFGISKEVQNLDNVASDNIQRLRELGEKLLDMPVTNVNIENGDTFIERGRGTNKDALIKFANELSKEYRARRSLQRLET